MLPKSLKGFSAFVDGRGYVGRLNEGQLPKLTIKTEEHRDGGMDIPVELDMGMEKLETSFSFAEYDPDLMQTFGLLDGTFVPLVLRGSLEGEDGTMSTVVATMRGICKELDHGSWKSGDKTELKYNLAPRYYQLQIDNNVVHEIDAENTVRIIGGVDQLAARRQALGI